MRNRDVSIQLEATAYYEFSPSSKTHYDKGMGQYYPGDDEETKVKKVMIELPRNVVEKSLAESPADAPTVFVDVSVAISYDLMEDVKESCADDARDDIRLGSSDD